MMMGKHFKQQSYFLHHPEVSTTELFELADLWWQAAVDLGPAYKLSDVDREYQRACFDRAADYAERAAAQMVGTGQ